MGAEISEQNGARKMRVHGGIAVVKLLATLTCCLQASTLCAQVTQSIHAQSIQHLAPVRLPSVNGKNAQSGGNATILPVAHSESLSAQRRANADSMPQPGIPLQPLVPISSLPPAELTLSPMLPGGDDSLPTVPPEAWGPGVALQPISRTNEMTATANTSLTSLPFSVLPMTKYDNSGGTMQTKAKLTTASMTGPMIDPLSTFSKLDIASVPSGPMASPVRNQQDYMPFSSTTYTWFSPVFSHHPLYFEQPNLERYGMGTNYYLQPAYSSVHFFSSVALMPYKVLTQHPHERVYTLGYGRPGNCEPYLGRTLIGQSYLGEACKVYDPYSGY